MSLKLLAIGDMHLGKQPSGLPAELANQASRLGPTAAWWRTIEKALESKVDLVALAGDLVDQEDDLFEAYRPLEQGINRLVNAGIEVVGISGNHDVAVLPKLADQLSAFKLLGRDGQWQTHTIEKNAERLTLHGWSFPRASVNHSPLANHRFERVPGLNLGLLHCDRDQQKSSYAPVTSQALAEAGLDGWLLGHIHKPDLLAPQHTSGYLGSLTGFDVGELGPRGPWLFSIERGHITTVTQWTLAPLVWWPITLDLTEIDASSDALTRLLVEIRHLDQKLAQYDAPPEAVGIRVTLTGETDSATDILQVFEQQRDRNWAVNRIPHIFVESVRDHTQPVVDLHALAKQANHIGQLARSILSLKKPATDPEHQAIVRQAALWLRPVAADERWQQLQQIELNESQVVAYLERAAHQLLRQMLDQSKAWHT